MKTDIQKYVAECDTCQRQKFEIVDPLGILQPPHILAQKWSEVSMDFITDLPTSEGKDIVFAVIERLTKHAHLISISSKEKTNQVANIYVNNIFKFHGFPKVIVSDRGPKFTSEF